LGINETHLKGNIEDKLINIEGFMLARRDGKASNKWCGCLIYYKESLNVIVRNDINASNDLNWFGYKSCKLLRY